MKITATVDPSLESILFRDEVDFIRHTDMIHDHAPREKLHDDQPERFPCLMLYRWTPTQNPNGANIVENFFLYDFVIHEGADRLDNALQLEDEGYLPSTETVA